MIEIINRQRKHKINQKKFKILLTKLAKHYKQEESEVCLVFTNSKVIKDLNRQFLKKNSPTDVLSFPMNENSPNGKYYLGDIVISVPQAYSQSISLGHSLERELENLLIHGFLHLLGFEHKEKTIVKEEAKIRKLILEEDNNGN